MELLESTSPDLLEHLMILVQYDIDTIYAYDQALENVEHADVRERLEQFREDHVRHVLELSSVLYGYGQEPPQSERDLKGFLLEGFTILRSMTGTEGALRALRMAEIMTNRIYEDTLRTDLPSDVNELISDFREDERHHLDFIEIRLEEFQEATRRYVQGLRPEAHP